MAASNRKSTKTTFVTSLSDVDSTDKEGIGSIRWEGNNCYKYVKFLNTTATVAGAAGDPVAYTAEDGYDDDEVCADISDADAKPIGAGCLKGTVAGTAGTAYYCWIQIKGMATLVEAIANSVDGTPVAAADGDPLVFGAADKVLRRANTVIDADAERRAEVAIAMDASAKTIICNFPF
jgi:hypothetical protein